MAFLISFFGCLNLIHKIYEKWEDSPVIVSFAEKSTPVWQIPFPAVTICPETKAKMKYVNFTKGYHSVVMAQALNISNDLEYDELKNLEAVSQICDSHLFAGIPLNSGLEVEEVVPLLKSITTSLNETTLFCKWRNQVGDCGQFFSEILTEEGFCYTFNVLNFDELFRGEK